MARVRGDVTLRHPTIVGLLCGLLLAGPVHAVDKGAAAAAAGSARQAYEAGNFLQAAEFYLQAYKAAPSQSGLLYNAARSLHLAGRLADAEAQYRVFLALPERDKAAEVKVLAYLEEVRQKRTELLVLDGDAALTQGKPVDAVAAYLEAMERSPERTDLWRKIADAELATGDKAAAITSLRNFLDKAAPNSPERGPVEARLAQLQAPIPRPIATQATASSGRGTAWLLTGLGAGAWVSAGGMAWWAHRAQADLDARLAHTDAQGFIVGTTWRQAQQDADAIGRHKTWAAVAGGVGAAASVAAVWCWLRPGSNSLAVLPSWSGATLVARF